jgi:tetratricopeptide (TPR) repeat protein
MRDWFRSPDWSINAQRDFESRLARAHPAGRAQYLRIKAVTLDEAGDCAAAVTLLRRIIRDHSDAWTECAFAHERLGDSYRATSDLARAEAEYRLALAVSPSLSGTTGEVHLKLGEVLLKSGTDTVAEVEQPLTAAQSHVTFNSTAFRFHVLTACVAAATGDVERRRSAAATALGLVDAGPQFYRHPTVGLVAASPSLLSELQTMASA